MRKWTWISGWESILGSIGIGRGTKGKSQKDPAWRKHRPLGLEPLETRQLLSVIATAPAARTVLTGALAPSLSVSANATVNQNAAFTLQLSSTDSLSGWVLAFGDGSTETLPGDASSATHTYTGTPEQYTVTATATDDGDATGHRHTPHAGPSHPPPTAGLPNLPDHRRADRHRFDGRPGHERARDKPG